MSDDLLNSACLRASAKISSSIGQIYGTDSSGATIPVPEVIQQLTLSVAAYFATLSYRKNKPLDARDPVQLLYNDALLDLASIQKGANDPDPQPVSVGAARGKVINTVPPALTPYDSGTVLTRGRVEEDDYPYPGALGGWYEN
jgi:hypothetical protein